MTVRTTVMFADLTGSTSVFEALGNEAATQTITALTQRIGKICQSHRGRVVKTLFAGRQAPGRYNVVWNGRDESGMASPSGVYFVRFKTDEFTQSRKMLMVK